MADAISPAKAEAVLPPSEPRPITVAETIVRQLRLWGVRRVYGVAGDAVFGFLDALAKQKDIAFISVKHESVASMMASAEAKLTGRLAVCIAQMGPGLANLLTGLGDAFMDRAPVLAITGQAPLDKLGTPYKQFVNQQAMVQAVSLSSQLVVHPDAVVKALTLAGNKALASRTVAHLSIPEDLFYMTSTSLPEQPPAISQPTYGLEGLDLALETIRSAKRPVMLIGGGARLHREALLMLAEVWGCGIAASYGAVGIVPDAHPQMLNGLGEGGNPYLSELFKEADVVLALETDWWPDGSVPRNVRVIHISRQPEIYEFALPADIGLAGDMTAILLRLHAGIAGNAVNGEWMNRVKRCKQAWSEQNQTEKRHSEDPLHPSSIVDAMERQLDDDAIVALDEGDATLWFLRGFLAKRQEVLLSCRWRTMGFGLPAAMAAKLCFPHRQVVCITGDGGLGMVLADLLTTVRYGLAITVIVFRNGTLQMERDKMLMNGLVPEGTSITNPDFVQIAEACGWQGRRIEHMEQLNKALKSLRSSGKPTLLSVNTARIPYPDYKK